MLAQFLATSGAGGAGPQSLKPMRVQTLMPPGPCGVFWPTKLSVTHTCKSTGPKS